MRHLTLTCKNHPQLRWNCKSIAYTPGAGYNGCRNIFFNGRLTTAEEQAAGLGRPECPCPPTDLVLAPEDPWYGLSESEQRAMIDQDSGSSWSAQIERERVLKE